MEHKLNGTQMQILEEIKKRPIYLERISKELNYAYKYTYENVKILKKNKLISEEVDIHDNRKKILNLTNEGKLLLAKIEAKKSAVSKIDSWLDKKFNEIGIDCARLFG